jgi:hypothetical protein
MPCSDKGKSTRPAKPSAQQEQAKLNTRWSRTVKASIPCNCAKSTKVGRGRSDHDARCEVVELNARHAAAKPVAHVETDKAAVAALSKARPKVGDAYAYIEVYRGEAALLSM